MKIRTTAPSKDNKSYINVAYGGNSRAISINNGFTLPNCVGIPQGRLDEIFGYDIGLAATNANTIYDAWKGSKGQTPKQGSVLCLEGGEYGHVAFVEKVNDDGTIDISQSVYGGVEYEYKTISKPYNIFNGYKLQGFIYTLNEEQEFPERDDMQKNDVVKLSYSRYDEVQFEIYTDDENLKLWFEHSSGKLYSTSGTLVRNKDYDTPYLTYTINLPKELPLGEYKVLRDIGNDQKQDLIYRNANGKNNQNDTEFAVLNYNEIKILDVQVRNNRIYIYKLG